LASARTSSAAARSELELVVWSMMAPHAVISSAGAVLLPITQSTAAEAGAARTRLIAALSRKARSGILANGNICAEERVPHIGKTP